MPENKEQEASVPSFGRLPEANKCKAQGWDCWRPFSSNCLQTKIMSPVLLSALKSDRIFLAMFNCFAISLRRLFRLLAGAKGHDCCCKWIYPLSSCRGSLQLHVVIVLGPSRFESTSERSTKVHDRGLRHCICRFRPEFHLSPELCHP